MNSNIEIRDMRVSLGIEENVIGLYIAKGDDPSPKMEVPRRAKRTGG